MTSRSDHSPSLGPKSGTTLLEVLVSLSILALIVSVAVSRFNRPDRYEVERVAAEISEAAAAARLRSITDAEVVVFEPGFTPCPGPSLPSTVSFHPDGTATEAALCVRANDAEIRFKIDPLTGRLQRLEGNGA